MPSAPPPFPGDGFPRLLPEVPLLWREGSTLQVGLDQWTGRLLPGVGLREQRALRALDGRRSLALVLDEHHASGGDPDWLRAAVRALHAAGSVVDAAEERLAAAPVAEELRLAPDLAALSAARPGQARAVMRRRQASLVQVRGTGRVGVGVATLLAAAGVGTVRAVPMLGDPPVIGPAAVAPLGPSAASIGVPARRAARDSIGSSRFAPRHPPASRAPALVVLCPQRVVPPETGAVLGASQTPHLTVMSDGPVARVGPLVIPGQTACLRCLELHRADRDARWPAILAQAAHTRVPQQAATDTVLATLAAATAALHALALIDEPGGPLPSTAGALLELRLPGLQWGRRRWEPHPDCGCVWSPLLPSAA